MFTLTDAMQMADKVTFDRGSRYFKTGRVLDVTVMDGPVDLAMAAVGGSERTPYTVQLERDGRQVLGLCSCPVRINCKHAVAALLQLVHDRQTSVDTRRQPAAKRTRSTTQPSAEEQLERWLQTLDADVAETDADVLIPGEHYLLYALSFARQGVQVSFYKAYLKQDLNWGKINSVSVDFYSLDHRAPAHICEADLPILKLLGTLRRFGSILLQGVEGGMALTRMLTTRRLLLDNPLRAVRTAAPAALQLHWQASDAGQQLKATLAGHAQWQLIPTEPPFFVDSEHAVMGAILTAVPVARLALLLAMPTVPANAMSRVALQLRQRFEREQLPLPEEPELHDLQTFVPHLTIVAVDTDGGVRMPGLRLQFAYGPVSVDPAYATPPVPQQLLEQDGRHYRIQRDLQAERAVESRLEAAKLDLFMVDDRAEELWMPIGKTATEAITHWMNCQRDRLPEWQAEGWRIDSEADSALRVHDMQLKVNLNDAQKGWFEFELVLQQGQWRFNTSQIVAHWLQHNGDDTFLLPGEKGEWLKVDLSPLQSIKGFIQELHQQKKLDKPVKLPPFSALALHDIDGLNSQRAPLTRKLMQELRDFRGLTSIKPPKELQAHLREYQQQGLNWLAFLHHFRLGGILADDMGLGKTLQALALILHLKQKGDLKKPALVICPTSLAGNWRREAQHFAPTLRVLVIHGAQRDELFKQIKHHDLVITTYPLLVRDHARYQKQNFALLVADEAQTIKNINTKAAQSMRTLNTPCRICLTGTPLENHLGELWALMDFALPGLLGAQDSFRKLFRQPIENDGDNQRRAELARRVAPFMIRRTKAEVVKELPPKTEMIQYVELEGSQRQLYESIRVSMEQRIRDLVKKKGMARSHIEFLDALLKLRQVCIDPRLVKLDSAKTVKEQAKLDWLQENLPQMVEEGRKVLVFSQFTEALALVEDIVQTEKLSYTKLTGKTRKRDEAIAQFQQGDASIFLISLKAGGSGLNLTAADTVIHVDPWWNPAVENQATDRAYRIGQDKPVFVYKLVAADTIEERIQQMQQHKQALADALFDDAGAVGLPSNAEELLTLLA